MEGGVSLRTGQLVQQLVLMKRQHRFDTDGAFVHRLKMVGNIVKVCIKIRPYCTWVDVFRINPEFRILRLTFHRKSASKC